MINFWLLLWLSFSSPSGVTMFSYTIARKKTYLSVFWFLCSELSLFNSSQASVVIHALSCVVYAGEVAHWRCVVVIAWFFAAFIQVIFCFRSVNLSWFTAIPILHITIIPYWCRHPTRCGGREDRRTFPMRHCLRLVHCAFLSLSTHVSKLLERWLQWFPPLRRCKSGEFSQYSTGPLWVVLRVLPCFCCISPFSMLPLIRLVQDLWFPRQRTSNFRSLSW